jgi:hypothetical protein
MELLEPSCGVPGRHISTKRIAGLAACYSFLGFLLLIMVFHFRQLPIFMPPILKMNMKKLLLLVCLVVMTTLGHAQKIKHFASYVKWATGLAAMNPETRYVAVLDDNSIYWFDTKVWQKTATAGLPANYDVTHVTAFSKEDGGRLVIVLGDNSIWWSSGKEWKPLVLEGLPKGKTITSIDSYVKMDGSRIVVTLADNSIWAYIANAKSWIAVPLDGLPKAN